MAEGLSAFAKSRKSNFFRRYAFLGVLLVLLLGTALYFVLENYFVVRDVSVKKSKIYATQEIVETIQIKKGTPLYKLDKKKIVSAIEEKFPYILNVKIKYKLPNTVQITYDEEYGELALSIGQDLFAIDTDLFVLAKESTNTDISRIALECSDIDRCVVGETLSFIDSGVGDSLSDILKALKEKEMLDQISRINLEDKFNLKIRYEDRFDVLLGDRQEMNLKLAMIREVILDLGEEASGRIDISDPDNAYVKLED